MSCNRSAASRRPPATLVPQALTYVALLMPNHLYELLPITVLIGTIFVMARLAQSSEFTILRTSGLGPWRALEHAAAFWVWCFVLLTFAVGDYLAPAGRPQRPNAQGAFRGPDLASARPAPGSKKRQAY